MKSSLAKNTVLLAMGTILNKLLQFVMIPFFSRWLSTEDYGSFDLFCTYALLLIPILTLASSEAVFRFLVDEEDDSHKKRYITNGFVICTCMVFAFIVVIIAFSAKVKWNYTTPFLLFVIGQVYNNYLQGYMRGIKKLNIYSFCSAISTVFIAVGVTAFVFWNKLGLSGILYGYAFGYIVGDLLIVIATKFWRLFDFRTFSIQCCKEMTKYSYPLIPNNICWWVIGASDRMIINWQIGAVANGVYAIAHKVPNLCSAIFGVFNISWQQAASEMRDDKEKEKYFNYILNVLLSLIISLCCGIVAINFVLFDYVFDLKYCDGRLYAPILVSALIFSSISNFFGGIQISMKRTKANGLSTMCGAIANVVIHIALVQAIGLYAACLSTVIAHGLVFCIRWIGLSREYVFRIDKRNIEGLIIFVFIVMSQFHWYHTSLIRAINMTISVITFCFLNRDLVRKYLRKVIKLRV